MTIVIAHRGRYSPDRFDSKPIENTVWAFKYAKKAKANWIEFDLRRTKDNKIVVFHDKKLFGKSLKDLSYIGLEKLANKYHFSVPLAEDVFIWARENNLFCDIELKETGFEEELISILERHLPTTQFIISSFSSQVLRHIKNRNQKIITGLITGQGRNTMYKSWLRTRLDEIFPKKRLEYANADLLIVNRIFYDWFFMSRFAKKYKLIVWDIPNMQSAKRYLKNNSIYGLIIDDVRYTL